MDPTDHAPRLSVVAAETHPRPAEAIGVINVEAHRTRSSTRRTCEFVEAVAGQISMAITHAALFDEDDFRTATDRLLVEATRATATMVMRRCSSTS